MSDIILRVAGIAKYFGGIHAVDDVSFEVERRKVTAVIGPNGAGKTTLFSVISGYHRPTRGKVQLENNEIAGLPPHRVAASGAVRTFQLVRLFGKMTLRENVMVGGHLATKGSLWSAIARPAWYRAQEADLVRDAEQHLWTVGLGPLADMKASALTYGQQRRLEIARALAARPKLLLLDEPAAGLSAGETKELLSIIRSITDNGTSVMLIDHDMDLIMEIADKVVVLDFGKKICEGTPAHVRQDESVLQAYLGKAEGGLKRRPRRPQKRN